MLQGCDGVCGLTRTRITFAGSRLRPCTSAVTKSCLVRHEVCRRTDTLLTPENPVVTICTASGHYMYRQWSLYVPPSGHYMYRQWSLYVPPSGHYMYRPLVTICTASLTFSNSTFCPTQCICVFCVDLRTNSEYFPIQH